MKEDGLRTSTIRKALPEEKKAPATKKPKIETFDISDSSHTMALAQDVAKFIKDNSLYQNVQGKEFVNVEGWQYAGSRLGIFPVVESVTDKSTETEIKYEAIVSLLDVKTNHIVGRGQAICSNKENGKKYYQEYAIASMAQTRGTGKAFRNILAWIIRAAGYEPTPAEEMDYQTAPEVKTVSHVEPSPQAAKATTEKRTATPKEEIVLEDFRTEANAPAEKPKLTAANKAIAEEMINAGKIAEAKNFLNGYLVPKSVAAELREMIKVKEAPAVAATPPPLPSEAKKPAAKKGAMPESNFEAESPANKPVSDLADDFENAGKEAQAAGVVKYATAEQKETIIRLLNNSTITRQEKTKMLLNINKLDYTRAGQSIDKLRKVIKEREDQK